MARIMDYNFTCGVFIRRRGGDAPHRPLHDRNINVDYTNHKLYVHYTNNILYVHYTNLVRRAGARRSIRGME